MAAQGPGNTVYNAAQQVKQNVKKAPAQMARQVAQAAKSEAKQVLETAGEQTVGLERGAPQQAGLPQPEQPFDSVAYAQEVKARDQQKLAQLKQLLSLIQAAGGERQQQEQAYHQQVERQMQSSPVLSQEQQVVKAIAQEDVPAAIKARRGTGESGKRSRKG